jgi:hypothetical protein
MTLTSSGRGSKGRGAVPLTPVFFFLLLLSQATLFATDLYSSAPLMKASTLSGIINISEKELYTEITQNGSWHYYEVYPNQKGVLPTIDELKKSIEPKGFTLLDIGIFPYSLIPKTKTVNTTASKEIISNLTNMSERILTATQKNVSYSQLSISTAAKEIPQNGTKCLLGVKTDNFQSGSYNPVLSDCGVMSAAGTYTNYSITTTGKTCDGGSTISGGCSDTNANDTTYWVVGEVAGDGSYEDYMNITQPFTKNTLFDLYYYGFHTIDALCSPSDGFLALWNYNTIGWEYIASIPDTGLDTTFADLDSATYAEGDLVQIKIYMENGCVDLDEISTDYVYANAPAPMSVVSGDNCFDISSDDVTLDCLGGTITGSGTGVGITSSSYNTIIRNCNISNYETDITLSGNNPILDNITFGTPVGLNVEGSDYGAYTNLSFTGITEKGIFTHNGADYNEFNIISMDASIGHGIYDEGGIGNRFNCAGGSLTGNNTTSYYGAYSSGINTTLGNCTISNFSTGVYFEGADGGRISNITINATGAYSFPNGVGLTIYNNGDNNTINNVSITSSGTGVLFYTAKNNSLSGAAIATTGEAIWLYSATNSTLANVSATATTNNGIRIDGGLGNYANNLTSTGSNGAYVASVNNTIANSVLNGTTGLSLAAAINCSFINTTANGNTSYDINFNTGSTDNYLFNVTGISSASTSLYMQPSANHRNRILNSTFTSVGAYTVIIWTNNDNIIANSSITGGYGSFGALLIYSGSSNNTISGNRVNGTGFVAIDINTGTIQNNTIFNNTIVNASTGIKISSGASLNTITQNNITAVIWINDANGSNSLNTSNTGNIYYFNNGTPSWNGTNGTNWTCSASCPWADGGATLPVNLTFFPGQWTGTGSDAHPFMGGVSTLFSLICSITYPPGSPYTTLCQLWQQVNVTCTDGAGITGRSITAYQYWNNGSIRNSSTANYTNGTAVMFNFTLNNSDAGGMWNHYNASGNASGTVNWTTTLNATVIGINTTICANAATPTISGQTDLTLIWVIAMAAFLLVMWKGGLTPHQTGYIALILCDLITAYGWNASVELGAGNAKYFFEIAFIFGIILTVGATAWYLLGVGRNALEMWKQKRL